jgi:hypothetical protein
MSPTFRARAVATPLLERSRSVGVSLGGTRSAAYFDFDGFVVAMTAAGVPLMPNGIGVDAASVAAAAPGARATLGPGRLDAGTSSVRWPARRAPAWDPTATPGRDPGRLEDIARAALEACGVDPGRSLAAQLGAGGSRGRGIALLVDAVATRDPAAAAGAARELLGQGPGLTPEGDDWLAGCAATVATWGDAGAWAAGPRRRWLGALCPSDARRRTTALSATLLELAVTGQVVEPAGRVLELRGSSVGSALADLSSLGHSSGRAYALAIGATAWSLGAPAFIGSKRARSA